MTVTIQTAATTGSGSAVQFGGNSNHLSIFVVGAGTISGGALQLEEAYDPDYAGTWSPFATAIDLSTLSGGKSTVARIAGRFMAIRARITSDVTGGGSVTVHAVGA